MDLWFRTTSTAIVQTLFHYGSDATAKRFFLTLENGNAIGVRIFDANIIYAAPNLADNAWHHVAFTMTSGARLDEVELYVDGVQLTTVQSSINPTTALNTATTELVRAGMNSTAPLRPFSGTLDEIRLYDRAMSAAEIQTLYTWTPLSVPEPNSMAVIALAMLSAALHAFATDVKRSSP